MTPQLTTLTSLLPRREASAARALRRVAEAKERAPKEISPRRRKKSKMMMSTPMLMTKNAAHLRAKERRVLKVKAKEVAEEVKVDPRRNPRKSSKMTPTPPQMTSQHLLTERSNPSLMVLTPMVRSLKAAKVTNKAHPKKEPPTTTPRTENPKVATGASGARSLEAKAASAEAEVASAALRAVKKV
jgi:hypothetical protein